MISTDPLQKKNLQFLNKWKIKKCSILIGCSGGPDSTALLSILNNLKEKLELTLYCAYLDHGLRKKEETGKEILLLERLCKKSKIGLYVKRIKYGKIKENAYKNKKSIEEEAREQRYKYLQKLKNEISADYIALGHISDDNTETVLMRFFQGVDFTGLCGIPEKRKSIIRPIINCTKKEILSYLKKNEIEYSIDKTNIESDFLRNKIRNILIPGIIEIFPGFKKSVEIFSYKMKLISDYFSDFIDLSEGWIQINNDQFKININDFNRKPPIIRVQSVYKIYNKIMKYKNDDKYYTLPYKFLNPLKIKYHDNRIILKGYGIIMYIRGEWLFFKRDVVVNNKKGYLINVNGDCSGFIKSANLHYKAIHTDKKDKDMLSLDVKRIKFPVIIRSKINGDYISIKKGRKSIKKLYNEWKVPAKERWKIPIISDRNGILCVMGKSNGFKNKYSYNCSFNKEKSSNGNKIIKYFTIIVIKNMENINSG